MNRGEMREMLDLYALELEDFRERIRVNRALHRRLLDGADAREVLLDFLNSQHDLLQASIPRLESAIRSIREAVSG